MPYYVPETKLFRWSLSREESGTNYTYYFVNVRRATPEEIDPPATPVTADELRSNGHKYIGQWVSMSDAIVRSGRGGLMINIGGENVVQTVGEKLRPGDHALREHILTRCYDEIEYKDIYKPEECTFNVKFRIADILDKDARLTDILAIGRKKGDVIANNFMITK